MVETQRVRQLYRQPFVINVAKPFSRKNIQSPAISMPALSRSGSIGSMHEVDDPVACNEVIPSESSSCG